MTIITIRLTISSKCKVTFFEGFFSETVYYSKKVSPCERHPDVKKTVIPNVKVCI